MDNVAMINMQPVPFGLVLLKYLHTPRRVAPFLRGLSIWVMNMKKPAGGKVGRCQTTDSILPPTPV